MKANLLAGFAGLMFGCGLAISGMGDGNKVVGFLDVVGNWDPSLGFVMVRSDWHFHAILSPDHKELSAHL